MPELPGAGGAAPPPDIAAVNGEGPPDDTPAAAAQRRRDEARAAYDAAMTSAAEMRDLAKRLNQEADAQEEQAQADNSAALEYADEMERGA